MTKIEAIRAKLLAFGEDEDAFGPFTSGEVRFLIGEVDAAAKVVEALRDIRDSMEASNTYPLVRDWLSRILREFDAREGGGNG